MSAPAIEYRTASHCLARLAAVPASRRTLRSSLERIQRILPNDPAGTSRESRFVANIMHQHYLVTSDNEGNFEVESVDTV